MKWAPLHRRLAYRYDGCRNDHSTHPGFLGTPYEIAAGSYVWCPSTRLLRGVADDVPRTVTEPIYKLIHRQVLESKGIALERYRRPGQDPTLDRTRTSRLWLYHGDREHPLLVYDYFEGNLREGEPQFAAFP